MSPRRVMGSHEKPIIQGQMACKEGQKHPNQLLGTRISLNGLSKA